jgi:hypothetical protein
MLMLIMGLHFQYINKINFTLHPFSSLYNLRDNVFLKVYKVLKLTKRYISLNKEVFYFWKYSQTNSLLIIITWRFIRIQFIITKESYGTKA